ncbi:DUF4956 domain-containing protein [candidate division KSB1 bacterium]|nr:DUF4956 domain-containing protein [candidate division KSB1 bacterium]
MNDAANPGKAAQRPNRVIVYYVLLFFFIFLASQLLGELSTHYNLERFAKISQLIQSAFDYWKNFDEVMTTLFALLLAFIFALPVAWIYTISKSGEDYDPSLVQTIVVLTMVVTGVMIVVGTELARAFGLVGVVAAVRFRNTLKDTKDAVYVFIAVALGMACGFGVYHIAVWLSVTMSLTMYLLWKFKFGQAMRDSAAAFMGKGNKKAVQLAYEQTSAATQERVEQAFERQLRLRQWTEMSSEKDKKKPNAAFIIAASDVAAAQNHIDKALAQAGGKWQLANVQSQAEGKAVLEYLGRVPKETTPAALLDSLRANTAGFIHSVEYLSLKGMKSPKPKTGENAEDDD